MRVCCGEKFENYLINKDIEVKKEANVFQIKEDNEIYIVSYKDENGKIHELKCHNII